MVSRWSLFSLNQTMPLYRCMSIAYILTLLIFFNRGIKHDFPFINIRKVPREVLKPEGEARGFQHFQGDDANVNE